MKKNIYVLDNHLSSKTNGIGTYTRELCQCLTKMNINLCLVLINCDIDEFTIIYEDNIKKVLFPVRPKTFHTSPQTFLNLFRLHFEDTMDNVFIVNHSPCEEFLVMLKESFPLSKIVFVIHDQGWTQPLYGDVEKLKKLIYSDTKDKSLTEILGVEQRMYETVDKIVALSTDTKKLLSNPFSIDKKKISHIPNGLRDSSDPENYSLKKSAKEKLYIDNSEKIILHIGRISYSKGSFNLIRSFKQILSEYPKCRLVMIGVLQDEDILKESADIASKIIYTGSISREKVKQWYQASDIGVIPSFTEQCSYSAIEMMMYGLPIVSSDGHGINNMFEHKRNALIAKIHDRENFLVYEKNLAKMILKLLKSNELCEYIGKNARLQYELQYTTEIMTENYRKLFLNL